VNSAGQVPDNALEAGLVAFFEELNRIKKATARIAERGNGNGVASEAMLWTTQSQVILFEHCQLRKIALPFNHSAIMARCYCGLN